MPRRNRRMNDEPEPYRPRGTTMPLPAPPGWNAERYRSGQAGKEYVCPRCHRTLQRSSDHVVAWRTDEDDRRRHWHAACWTSAVNEGIDRYRWT